MSKEELYNWIAATLDDKSTFGFNELRLNKEVNQQFCDDEKVKNTLELFCFGSIRNYNGEHFLIKVINLFRY